MVFRKDIQGLRAIAVLVVVLFHCGFDFLSGGFIGVDIFFVLSGFLITNLLIKEISSGSFSLIDFYAKRIRRLYPALLATIMLTLVVGYFIFMPDEFLELGQSTVSLVFYASNIFFWLKSDYFDGPSELKPLLHSWSLSVEEQFYLIFPLILLLAFSLRLKNKGIVSVLLAFALISFFACELLMNVDHSAAFFLTPFRIWEFMLGSLCVFVPNLKSKAYLSSVLSLIGLIVILLSLFFIDEATSFPGITALPICLGTAFIIIFNSSDTICNRILSFKPLLFMGKVSYSTYLFHWPLVVFYGYYQMRELYVYEKVALTIVSFIGGYVMFRFIENTLRVKKLTRLQLRNTFIYSAVFTLAFGIVGATIHFNKGFPSRIYINNTQNSELPRDYPLLGKCVLNLKDTFDLWEKESCYIGDYSQHHSTILIWGDSHADHLIYGLAKHKTEIHKNLLIFANAGCAPILNESPVGRPNCLKNNEHIFENLLNLNITHIVLVANWQFASASDVALSSLSETVNKITNLGFKVSIINQLPVYSINNPQYLLQRLEQSEGFNGDWEIEPSKGNKERLIIANIAKATKSPVFDSFNAFCLHSGKCQIVRNYDLMVKDKAHLSYRGSEYFVNYIINSDDNIFK